MVKTPSYVGVREHYPDGIVHSQLKIHVHMGRLENNASVITLLSEYVQQLNIGSLVQWLHEAVH